MTPQTEESKHITAEMCAVLRYTAEHGCMAKIGEPWPLRSLCGATDAGRRGGAEHMAVVCGSKLGLRRKSTILRVGVGCESQ
jgi:hypothetical protein